MSKEIRTENLSVGYGRKIVIDGINICIEPGKITTLIGPNGCGKSTILKSILGQLQTIKGCIYAGDERIQDINRNELAKSMAMVMTKRPKTELMTCLEIVETGRYPYTGHFGRLTEEDHIKVNEAFEYIGATELKNEDFNCISDGQKQRIMIARAIAQEPEVLILDEPTSFLDIRFKLDILNCIRKLSKEKNVAVIMSLHELELAKKISDTIIAVDEGHIGKIGSPQDIFTGGYIQKLYNINDENFDEERGIIIMSEWD